MSVYGLDIAYDRRGTIINGKVWNWIIRCPVHGWKHPAPDLERAREWARHLSEHLKERRA